MLGTGSRKDLTTTQSELQTTRLLSCADDPGDENRNDLPAMVKLASPYLGT